MSQQCVCAPPWLKNRGANHTLHPAPHLPNRLSDTRSEHATKAEQTTSPEIASKRHQTHFFSRLLEEIDCGIFVFLVVVQNRACRVVSDGVAPFP